jgi:hypothetical protein
MSDDNEVGKQEAASQGRRSFVKTSAQVAVTAPAVAMLLKASTKPAFAAASYNSTSSASLHHILDDFTFGNTNEDIDAIHQSSNFNFRNQTPQQDDHVA